MAFFFFHLIPLVLTCNLKSVMPLSTRFGKVERAKTKMNEASVIFHVLKNVPKAMGKQFKLVYLTFQTLPIFYQATMFFEFALEKKSTSTEVSDLRQ